jgi:hypothetical protein
LIPDVLGGKSLEMCCGMENEIITICTEGKARDFPSLSGPNGATGIYQESISNWKGAH